jgi:glycosyltransferase involved in cell wall biosynthesis
MLASKDHRVKPVRIFPTTGGNVGEAKHRAASLANGNWLVELDHDDYLMPDALETLAKASQKHPDAGFLYSDCCEMYENGEMRQYGYIGEDWYGHPENKFDWGYAGHTWENIDGKNYLVHHYPNINPKSIRFNIGMPNHVRVWRKDIYNKVGGHNRSISVADDFELIVKTFLETKFVHIEKMLYIQYNNHSSTVDINSVDINRRARLIRDSYDKQIHQRILNLGGQDWNWNEETQSSYKLQNWMDSTKYGPAEQVLNYIYTPNE